MLRKLITFSLKFNPLTDAGLLKLKALKNLKMLDVTGCPVTAEGMRALEKELPGRKVTR